MARPEQSHKPSKGHQREQRRLEQKRTQKRNKTLIRIGVAVASFATLGGIATAAWEANNQEGNSDNTPILSGSEIIPSPKIFSEQEMTDMTAHSAALVNSEFKTEITAEEIKNHTIIVPRAETLSQDEQKEWCALLPCNEALGFTTLVNALDNKPLIYLNTSLIERESKLAGFTTKDESNNLLQSVTFNELFHYLSFGSEFSPVPEKAKADIMGFFWLNGSGDDFDISIRAERIVIKNIGSDEIVINYPILSQLQSSLFEEYMDEAIGIGYNFSDRYNRHSNDLHAYGNTKVLFDSLLEKIGTDRQSELKTLFTYIFQNEYLEWIKYVGSQFVSEEDSQLRFGLEIMQAIQEENTELFANLTQK